MNYRTEPHWTELSIRVAFAILAVSFVITPRSADAKKSQSVTGKETSKSTKQQKKKSKKKKLLDKTKQDAAEKADEESKEPDEWSTHDTDQALKSCLKIISSVRAEIYVDEPIKKGLCGSPAMVRLKSITAESKVTFRPPVLVNCAMVARLADWVGDVLLPVSKKHLGSPITEIRGANGYACRQRNNDPKAKISEHAFANAIDIPVFKTQDARKISVLKHWLMTKRNRPKVAARVVDASVKLVKTRQPRRSRGRSNASGDETTPPAPSRNPKRTVRNAIDRSSKAKANLVQKAKLVVATESSMKRDPRAVFLRDLHRGACKRFGTVLGPEANAAHRDHFHFDLAARRRSSYCE